MSLRPKKMVSQFYLIYLKKFTTFCYAFCFLQKAFYGQQMNPVDEGYTIVNLEFMFLYCGTAYTQVTISSNGYVCLGNNTKCGNWMRPSPYDILVGLNHDLNPTRNGSGQIYFKSLARNSDLFVDAQDTVNCLYLAFEAANIFMITYDNVLPYTSKSKSNVSLQIFLLSDSQKYYVTFKFMSCPTDVYLEALSGLTHNIENKLQQISIMNPCTSSNVGQSGIWVIEVTSYSTGKLK
jgi:hypothetical protein